MRKRVILVIVLGAVGLLGLPGIANAHPFNIYLRDADGNPIAAGSNTPYSPKRTCTPCHGYENDPIAVTKQQTVGGTAGAPYTVLAPSHGATAGFHFQQGLNLPWGDTQRSFYGLPAFTSSPGMVGKF